MITIIIGHWVTVTGVVTEHNGGNNKFGYYADDGWKILKFKEEHNTYRIICYLYPSLFLSL